MKKLDPYDGKKGLEILEKVLIDFESMDEHEFMDYYDSIQKKENVLHNFHQKISIQEDMDGEMVNIVNENFWDLLENKDDKKSN